jgi:tRNA threonylcarbamoyladenosine biosynthesis protein TsaE
VEKHIPNLDALAEEARAFITALTPGAQATLVTLSGELGAGKTAFTQAVARALGIDEHVTSPTFVLEKIYDLPAEASFKRLVHIDAYRLSDGSDLGPLGFDALMKDGENLILLEWPEKVADALPPPIVSITLAPHADGSRTLTYAYRT